MRHFRSDRENLKDTRIVYTLLLSVTVIALLLGVVAAVLSSVLHNREVSRYYESLTLCADALGEWDGASGVGERYSASLRFERAAATLPDGVPLGALMSLADYMRMGDAANERVHAFADGFALLSAREYASADEAKRIICETLGQISSQFEDAAADAEVKLPPQDILNFTHNTAKQSMKDLLGGAARSLELSLSEENAMWRAEADNIRLDFSCVSGALESFVYIRVGDTPDTQCSEQERAAKAMEFYRLARGGSQRANVTGVNTVGGFSLCEISDGDEWWRVCVDTYGRVWSLSRAGE